MHDHSIFYYKGIVLEITKYFIIQLISLRKLFLTFALSIITEKLRILSGTCFVVLMDAYMVAVDSYY